MAQRLPSARLVELEGIGHLSLRAGGERIQAEIERFLKEVGRPADGRKPSPTECSRRSCSPTSSTRRRRRSSSVTGAGAICSSVTTRWYGASCCDFAAGRSTRPATAFSPPLTAQRERSAARRAIVDGVHELGLSVRAGLHTGECEIADGKVAGIAVHTGARVAALGARRRGARLEHRQRLGRRLGNHVHRARATRAEGDPRRVAAVRRRGRRVDADTTRAR